MARSWLVAASANPQPVLAEIAIKALTVLGGFGLWEASALEREKANAADQTQKEGSRWLSLFYPILKTSGSVLFRLNLFVLISLKCCLTPRDWNLSNTQEDSAANMQMQPLVAYMQKIHFSWRHKRKLFSISIKLFKYKE